LAVDISDKVNASYKGAIELKTDRIAVISKVVTSADIFEIDTLISVLTDELKGKMMSLSSGMFSYKDRFIALRDDIFRHPEKEWNIESIIRSMGISKSHFQRIYKELFDTSCKEDIITSRMEKAKWLLENTIIPVTQIAEQCGYFNSSHFIRQFGTRVEMTPSDYRRKFGKE
jgi:AraC-like DNA-binding protein